MCDVYSHNYKEIKYQKALRFAGKTIYPRAQNPNHEVPHAALYET
jgi:hypothetical protein